MENVSSSVNPVNLVNESNAVTSSSGDGVNPQVDNANLNGNVNDKSGNQGNDRAKRIVIWSVLGILIVGSIGVILYILLRTDFVNTYFSDNSSNDSEMSQESNSSETDNLETDESELDYDYELGDYKVRIAEDRSVLDLDLFGNATLDSGYTCDSARGSDCDSAYIYELVGTITEGEYNGYEVIYATAFRGVDFVIFRGNTNLKYFDSGFYSFIFPGTLPSEFLEIEEDASIISYFSQVEINLSNISFNVASILRDDGLSNSSDIVLQASSSSQPIEIIESITSDNGILIYEPSEEGSSVNHVYSRMDNGYYKEYSFSPYFMVNDEIPAITWFDTVSVTNRSEYFEHINSELDLDKDLLEIVGKSNMGDDIYAFANSEDDEILEKVYEEDYLANDLNESNNLWGDNDQPFSFEEYLSYHPIIYWFDPFGNVHKYISRDFGIEFQGAGAKPVIYLYPENQVDLTVNLNIDGRLTGSNPKYNNGWEITSYPDGSIYDESGNSYDYLFWEGKFNRDFVNLSTGWMVKKEEVESFLDTKLDELGFSSKEKMQFLDFWLSRMMDLDDPYLWISFVDEEVLDQVAPISVSMTPDSYRRYFMLFRGELDTREVVAPEFNSFEREGFFMFEWGGSMVVD